MTFKIGEPVSEANPLPVVLVDGVFTPKIGEPISDTNPRFVQIAQLIGSALTSASLQAALAAKGITDAAARAAIGSAASLEEGLAALGLIKTAPSTIPARALTFSNLEPLQFTDGAYLELES